MSKKLNEFSIVRANLKFVDGILFEGVGLALQTKLFSLAIFSIDLHEHLSTLLERDSKPFVGKT